LASLGMPEFEEMDVWYGVTAPRAGTPPEALAALRGTFREALAEPSLQFIARQVALWEELVQASATLD
jgi:tripartite-type tricarboxylate transporter receptor subunit TctC